MLRARATSFVVAAACSLALACGSDVPAVHGTPGEPRADAGSRATQAPKPDAESPRQTDAATGLRDAGTAAAVDGGRQAPASDASSTSSGSSTKDAGKTSAAAGSCFGRCGAPELLAMAADCACDVGCLARGECCEDKHELCSVSERSPLCTLTGLALDPALCGTDLGWSFSHEDHVEVLYGDSYAADCVDPYPNDDAQGTLPLLRPTLLPTRLPAQPVSCNGLLSLDKRAPATAQNGRPASFAPILQYQGASALSSFLSETPLTGFSDGEHAYMIARRGNDIADPIYVSVRDPSASPNVSPGRTVYRVGQTYASSHFQNPTAATVKNFVPDDPSQNDYGPGAHTLLLFGRGNFAGIAGREVHLAQQRLPLLQPDGRFVWSPQYFAGMRDGKPSWTSDEKAAVAVLSNDFERVMQMEVAWVPALAKWIMLYGGDVADWLDDTPNDQPRHGAIHMRTADQPWGPWTRATPVFWREHAAAFLHCDAPAAPTPGNRAGCDLDELPNDPAHSYSPGTWGPQLLDFPGCIGGDLTPSQPNFQPGGILPCGGSQRGNLYAPSLIDSWTADLAGDQGYAHAATMYFMVSTWMPYQVILASLTVHLP